jgi:hypothetical protein
MKAYRRHFRWLGWRAPVSTCYFPISVSAPIGVGPKRRAACGKSPRAPNTALICTPSEAGGAFRPDGPAPHHAIKAYLSHFLAANPIPLRWALAPKSDDGRGAARCRASVDVRFPENHALGGNSEVRWLANLLYLYTMPFISSYVCQRRDCIVIGKGRPANVPYVVEIYRRYLALKSVRALRDELAYAGIESKRRYVPSSSGTKTSSHVSRRVERPCSKW